MWGREGGGRGRGGGVYSGPYKKSIKNLQLLFLLLLFVCFVLFCFINMLVDWVYNTKLLTYTNIPLSLVDTSPSDCIVLYVFALYSLLHQFADRAQCDL